MLAACNPPYGLVDMFLLLACDSCWPCRPADHWPPHRTARGGLSPAPACPAHSSNASSRMASPRSTWKPTMLSQASVSSWRTSCMQQGPGGRGANDILSLVCRPSISCPAPLPYYSRHPPATTRAPKTSRCSGSCHSFVGILVSRQIRSFRCSALRFVFGVPCPAPDS